MSLFNDVLTNAGVIEGFFLGHPCGVLSDGTLFVVAQDNGGAPTDWNVYTSVDGGVTWAKALKVTGPTTNEIMSVGQSGDSLYVVRSIQVNNNAMVLFRADYNAASLSWALGVNGATVGAAISDHYFTDSRFVKDPTGRCWIACRTLQTGVAHRWKVFYSNDNGANWTFSLEFDTSGGNASIGCPMIALQTKLVLFWGSSNGGDVVWRRERAHTDSPTTWGNKTSTGVGKAATFIDADAASESPILTGMMTATDWSGSGTTYAKRVNESGGALSYTTITGVILGTTFAPVSGRTDGFISRYIQDNDLGNLHLLTISKTATAWSTGTIQAIPSPNARNSRYSAASGPIANTIADASANGSGLFVFVRNASAPFLLTNFGIMPSVGPPVENLTITADPVTLSLSLAGDLFLGAPTPRITDWRATKGAGAWAFSAQPNVLGYINNPRWTTVPASPVMHQPCGYWWRC